MVARELAEMVRAFGAPVHLLVVIELLRGRHPDGKFCLCWLQEARDKITTPELAAIINALMAAAQVCNDAAGSADQRLVADVVAAAEEITRGGAPS